MALRVCLEAGCPELCEGTRCPAHAKAKDQERGTSTSRGYGSKHQRLRAEWQARIDNGKAVFCWRPGCGRRITGTHWHLGHDDLDRTIYRGPECIPCNTRTATRRGA